MEHSDNSRDDRRGDAVPPEPAPAVTAHEFGRRTYIIADVEPLDVDGVRTVAVGSALWLVGFVLLLPFSGRLAETDRLWWLWTCLAGFGLGVIGWDYCRRRRKKRNDPRASPTPPSDPPGQASRRSGPSRPGRPS